MKKATYWFLAVLVFVGVFAPFIASSQPLRIYDKAAFEQKTGQKLKRSPLFYTFVFSDPQVEKLEYRRLAEKGEIGAIFTLIPYSPYEADLENYLKGPELFELHLLVSYTHEITFIV